MAGINVPQYNIFKIGTNKLKYNDWDLTITKDQAFLLNEMVSLFQGQEFRHIANILNKDIRTIDFSKYICMIVIEKLSDFSRATSKKGIKINGITYKRFVGTNGGLKNNTLLFVNIEVIDELNKRCECGRNKKIPLVPSKYESYKALSCSASQPIINPNKILVVRDCLTKITDTIISLDNDDLSKSEPVREYIENAEIENNASDGFNLCTYDYMKLVSESLGLDYVTNGVCIRNAWVKGMLYPFPIVEFFEKYHKDENGDVDYFVKDIWGNYQDIRECDMILTESSLKLWSAYDSVEEYMRLYKENGYTFAVTKISPNHLDEQRELNYQYIQSYDLSDEDIAKLCDPTIDKLKNALCGDYESTLKFIGGSGDDSVFSWQKALQTNECMLSDPYIIDCVHRMIKKKIDCAKIGKLVVDGNYQIASGDPFLLMESICGLEPKGLLKANEVYSSYWINKGIDEVVVFRSPMTSHNNIRKCFIPQNEEISYWYQYMDNIMIVNGWDTFCQSENGCDYDGDILFSTNNEVLLNNHRQLPAIVCKQSNTPKVEITETAIKKTNKNGMGNQVGTITNRVTGMMEVQSRFPKDSKEWEVLQYRIECGQLYQQAEIDKIKGIISRPMPNYWYSVKSCEDDFSYSISLDKKPYFMIYVYEDYKRKMKKYITSSNQNCKDFFNCSIEELLQKEEPTEEEKEFIYWYNKKMPFGTGPCAMNKVCWYVEKNLDGHKSLLKKTSDFDYSILKVKGKYTKEEMQQMKDLCAKYSSIVKKYKSDKANVNYKTETIFIDSVEQKIDSRHQLASYFKEKSKEICPDDNKRQNIILDLCYKNRNNMQFCWDTIGDLICKRLEEINEQNNNQ